MRINIAERILLLGFVSLMISGLFLPVYSDEVMAKWSLGRLLVESGGQLSFFPQCGASMGHATSIIFYPAGVLLAFIYSGLEPLGVRVSGIALSLIWMASVCYWSYQETRNSSFMLRRLCGFLAICSVGVSPYLWVLSRPEQILTLSATVLCLFALFANSSTSPYRKLLAGMGIALTLSCFFYSHPKSIFLLPFALVVSWFAMKPLGRVGQVLFSGLILAFGYQVFKASSGLSTCTDAPGIQQILAANTLLPSLILTDPLVFFAAVGHNLWMFPDRFLMHLTFSPTFQSGWLPPLGETSHSALFTFLNAWVYFLIGAVVIGAHLVPAPLFFYSLIKGKVSPALTVAVALAASDIANVMFYNLQNFYAGTQFLPLSAILVMLMLSEVSPGSVVNRLYAKVHNIVVVLAIVSMSVLLSSLISPLIKNASVQTAAIEGQPLSIPVLNAESHLLGIRELGMKCNIPEGGSQSLVVDHMTYFAYAANKTPIHVLYISELGYGSDLVGGKMVPLLRKLKSPGVIARCEWIPDELKSIEKKNDMGYCCVNLDDAG